LDVLAAGCTIGFKLAAAELSTLVTAVVSGLAKSRLSSI
jgi:hypothetical protein